MLHELDVNKLLSISKYNISKKYHLYLKNILTSSYKLIVNISRKKNSAVISSAKQFLEISLMHI